MLALLLLAATPGTTAVDAAQNGFEICVVYNASGFGNRGSEPREAVKLGLVACADEMNRLRSIWINQLSRGYATPPDPEEVRRQFNDYVAEYCLAVETIMQRHLAERPR